MYRYSSIGRSELGAGMAPTGSSMEPNRGPDVIPDETRIEFDANGMLMRIPPTVLLIVLSVFCMVVVGSLKAQVAGFLGILIFGYLLLVLSRVACLARHKPAITLNRIGVSVLDPITCLEDSVDWSQVVALEVSPDRRGKNGPFLLVKVADPSLYLKRGNAIQKAMRQWVHQDYGTPILLWAQGKEIESFEKLCSLTSQYYQRFGNSSDTDKGIA